MDKTTEELIQRLINDLDYAAKTAPTLQQHPKHLKQLLKHPTLLQALKNDPALFTTLLLTIQNQPFKPLPYQTQFLRDQNKRIVVCSGRQIGKTTMAAAKAIWYAYMHPNTTTLIVSKALRQSMWMFDKIRTMTYTNPILKELIKTRHGTTNTRITLKPPINSKIIALPPGNDGNTIRGLTANLLIIDEANYIKPTIITSVITPMITATDGTLILISTPQYADHPFMQAFTHAAERGYSAYHLPSHIAPIPTPELRQQFLREQQQQIPHEEYQREYLAQLPDETNQLIPSKYIHNCIQDYQLLTEAELFNPTKHVHADYAGYDPGGKQNPAAFITLTAEGKTARLTYIRETQNEPYGNFTAFIKHAHTRLQLTRIAVDATGLGKPITEDLQRLGLPIHPITITQKTRLNLFRWLTATFQQNHIIIPDHPKLLQQLKSLRLQYHKTTNQQTIHTQPKITKPANVHDDIAYALALALHTMHTTPNGVLLTV